ncbi:MAG: alpha-glucan family phosphorylase [Chloroflexi bacterium]|nr:alpha-glucan family phosphorylase [Chloroflexota bacterium]
MGDRSTRIALRQRARRRRDAGRLLYLPSGPAAGCASPRAPETGAPPAASARDSVRPLRTFFVRPTLPTVLSPLRDLAYNLAWAWNVDALDIFRRLDGDLWGATGHNPVRMLGLVGQERLRQAAEDDGFLAQLERVTQWFRTYTQAKRTWFDRVGVGDAKPLIAYFSFEYGLTECLPIYSGGMGVLAGDHLKSASDLGVPVVGVGLAYQEGYFQQYLNVDGWQGELYPDNDFYTMPMALELDAAGRPVTIGVEYPGRRIAAQVWRVQVGRVPLLLLDANLPENDPHDRLVTDRLYGGDPDMRIRQEILLGIGGMRALAAVGAQPTVCHMNEGHAAFLALERIRQLVHEHGVSFAEAAEVVETSNIFTTHTPVAAGIDYFGADLIGAYFSEYVRELGISVDDLLALGRQRADDPSEPFCMAVLAVRLSAYVNGVSKLHSQVSRQMWHNLWPGLPASESPITSVTNGVHLATWLAARDLAPLYDRYLSPRWREDPSDRRIWEGVQEIPDEELWRTHERCRERLVGYTRSLLRRTMERQGATPHEINRATEALDPAALTIGFARRFATYKRAMLLFRDPDRLAQLLGDRARPVQILIAGKAHPQDTPGHETIRQLIHLMRRDEFRGRIVFLVNYGVEMARYLVQGVDLWLNTPRRPLEASGTSGMKVAMNGGLNVSVLDGWWCEGYRPDLGWAVGRGEEYPDPETQDEVEARALYELLEKNIVPLFYDRGPDGLPRGWIARMKASIAGITPVFNTHRVVGEYTQRFYLPAHAAYRRLSEDGFAPARSLAAWRQRVRETWPQVRVVDVSVDGPEVLAVGDSLHVLARIRLGPLRPDEVLVQVLHGPVTAEGEIGTSNVVTMTLGEEACRGEAAFGTALVCAQSGLHGFLVRVLPRHPDLPDPFEPRLVVWSQ